MLKFRNIVIIFLVMLVCISTVCMIIEANLVTNAARTATTYTQIAAECALKSATMTDEFFTSGTSKNGSYMNGVTKVQAGTVRNTAGSSGLLIDLNNGAGVDSFSRDEWDTNIYALTFGISSSSNAQRFAEDAYLAMFSTDEFKNWSSTLLDNSLNQSNKSMTYSLCTRPIMWFDTFLVQSGTNINIKQASGTVFVPKLLTMGGELFADELGVLDTSELYTKLSNNNVFSTGANTVKKFFGTIAGNYTSIWAQDNSASNAEKAKALLENADYWNYKRQTTITLDQSDFGTLGTLDVDYYYTPTSLGLTYIDPNMLDILFRSNLDLLMRCGYIENGNLADYNSQINPGYYNELDDATLDSAAWANCAVNNGQFYYMRGIPTFDSSHKLHYTDLNGMACQLPEIEYYYIPISDSSDKNYSKKSLYNTVNNLTNNSALRNVIYRAIDAATTPRSLLDEQDSGNDAHTYELVVAKVTFYADFVYPYKTSTLRGMAHWWGDDSLSGLHLSENDTVTMGITQDRLDDLAGVPYTTVESIIDGGTQYKYTTYYAIAV